MPVRLPLSFCPPPRTPTGYCPWRDENGHSRRQRRRAWSISIRRGVTVHETDDRRKSLQHCRSHGNEILDPVAG